MGCNIEQSPGIEGTALETTLEVVRFPLDKGANVNAMYGMSGLYPAASNTDVELLDLLLDRGIGNNLQSSHAGTALLALGPGHRAPTGSWRRFEREESRDWVSPSCGSNVGAADSNGRTAHHLAARKGRLEVIRAKGGCQHRW